MPDSTPIGIIPRLKLWLFGAPKPREIWNTDKETFLRHEDTYSWDYRYPIDTYAVYAIHQTSLTTGNTRIVEDWRLT